MNNKVYILPPLDERITTYQMNAGFSEDVKKPTKKQKLYRQKLELMTYRDDFNDEILKLRLRYEIPLSGFNSYSDCKKWVRKQNQKKYDSSLLSLLDSFTVAVRWIDAIEYYLLFGVTNAWYLLPDTVDLQMIKDEQTNDTGLFLRIYKDTKIEDIKIKWKSVQKMKAFIKPFDKEKDYHSRARELAKKKDRKLESGSLELQKKIYELHLEGKNSKEIGRIVNRSYDTVNIYLHRFKKELKNVKLD